MTRSGSTAYLQTMFVEPHERGSSLDAALVKRAHDELDARESQPCCCTTAS